MGELANLPNIGPVVEQQLNEVGIFTEKDLAEAGAKEAWLKIQKIDESACIHRLLSFEAAIMGVKKSMLPVEIKEDLKGFYRKNKIQI